MKQTNETKLKKKKSRKKRDKKIHNVITGSVVVEFYYVFYNVLETVL